MNAAAAVGAAQEAQAPAGGLYLTSTALASGGACGASGQGAPITWYEMSDQKPEPGKAYSGISGGGFSCAFNFKYTAVEDSVLTDDFLVFLLVGCDVAGHAIELDYNFLVGSDSVSGAVRPAVSYTCTGSSSVFTYEQTFDGGDTPVAAGDELTLTLNLFAAAQGPSAAGNWHIKTGDAATPSGVFGAGLPGGISAGAAGAPEVFNLTAPAEAPSAGPNETLDVPFTIQNGGLEEANFTVNATNVPDGFAVAFDVSNGTVAAAGSANVTASIAIPGDASQGDYSLDVVVSGLHGGNATLTLAFSVGSPANTPGGNETAGPADANETGEPADADGGAIPGPGFAFAIAAGAAAVLVVARRRA